MNDNADNEAKELEKVVATAVNELQKNGYCWINSNGSGLNYRNSCGKNVADKAVREFLARGYHVLKGYNLAGRWSFYKISKKELSTRGTSEILG